MKTSSTTNSARHWRVSGLVAVSMLCAIGAANAAGPPVFKVDPSYIPQLPADERFGDIPSVAVDAKDNVWIIHRQESLPANADWVAKNPVGAECCKPAPVVVETDPHGKILRSWGGPGWDHFPSESLKVKEHTHGIFVDHEGNVWIAFQSFTPDGTNTVNKYTPDGKFILQLGTSAMSTDGLDPEKFGRPNQFAEDAKTNELFIADGYLNRRIIVFDLETGKFKRMWGAYGKPPNKGLVTGTDPHRGSVDNPDFDTMHAIAVTNDGLVYGADRVNNRIQVFKEDGTYVKQFAHKPNTLYWGSVWGVAWSPVYPNYILVADGMNAHLDVLDRNDGKIVASYGRDGPWAGQFSWIHCLAVDSKGNVYTAEVSGGHRVQKWLLQK